MKTLVVLPMGAHPFHTGHMALYNSAKAAFPDSDVYIAATNDTSARPFPFAVKQKLAKLSGVPENRFIPVKSPFQAREITQHYDPATTQLIFVRSEKDAAKPPLAGGTKKDGTPAYLQPISDQMAPMNQHAYMAYLPTVEFGPGMTSATEIRSAWPTLNPRRKSALVMSLYPATQSNPKLAATVVKMLDTAMGAEAQDMSEGFSNDMSTEDMIAYLRQHHDKNLHQDYVNHLTSTNSKFVLKNIPLTSIKTELSGLDRAKVEKYKQMDFAKAPPIVVGSDGNILDGYHRATVAKALSIPAIKAYVGVKGQQRVNNDSADYLDESR